MLLLLADVTAKPVITGLPGSNVLQQLVDGAEAWALAAALIGAFVGAALARAQPPLRRARTDGGGDLGGLGARDRSGPRARELLPTPRGDR
jgi:hypothetical protein